MINDPLIKLRLYINVLRMDRQAITSETYTYLKDRVENESLSKFDCDLLDVAFLILESQGSIDNATYNRLSKLLFEVRPVNLGSVE